MSRLASVSVDLDEVIHYLRIHGLPEGTWAGRARVTRLAGERLGERLARRGIPATAFVIGETLAVGEAARTVAALAAAGHEIANHTQGHDYRLGMRAPDARAREIDAGAESIRDVVGQRPVGFRTPGYNLDEGILAHLQQAGYRYDASVLPSPPYYGARALVIGAMRAAGRRSASQVGRLAAALAPRRPYRPRADAFWRAGGEGLLELPMTVVPGTGVPFIGTTLAWLPWRLVQGFTASVARLPFVSLELHGVDLLDASDLPVPGLAARQRDLQVPTREKLRRLDAVLDRLADTHAFVTLAEAASRLAPEVAAGSRVP